MGLVHLQVRVSDLLRLLGVHVLEQASSNDGANLVISYWPHVRSDTTKSFLQCGKCKLTALAAGDLCRACRQGCDGSTVLNLPYCFDELGDEGHRLVGKRCVVDGNTIGGDAVVRQLVRQNEAGCRSRENLGKNALGAHAGLV